MKKTLLGLLCLVGCADSKTDSGSCAEVESGIYNVTLVKKTGDCPEEFDESSDRVTLPRNNAPDDNECSSNFAFDGSACVYRSEFVCAGFDDEGAEIELNFSGTLDVIGATRLEGEQEMRILYEGEEVCRNVYEAVFRRE